MPRRWGGPGAASRPAACRTPSSRHRAGTSMPQRARTWWRLRWRRGFCCSWVSGSRGSMSTVTVHSLTVLRAAKMGPGPPGWRRRLPVDLCFRRERSDDTHRSRLARDPAGDRSRPVTVRGPSHMTGSWRMPKDSGQSAAGNGDKPSSLRNALCFAVDRRICLSTWSSSL